MRFLPDFERDLDETLEYISSALQNPIAAEQLIDDVEKAIQKRIEMPLAFESVRLLYDPQHAYYKIYVKNYIIYYVVIDDVVEFRRFLYAKRNVEIIR